MSIYKAKIKYKFYKYMYMLKPLWDTQM